MVKFFLSFLVGFGVVGIFFFSILVHEAFHVVSSDSVQSFCVDFGQSTVAHVDVIDSTPDNFEEAKAFGVGTAVAVLLSVLLIVGVLRYYG